MISDSRTGSVLLTLAPCAILALASVGTHFHNEAEAREAMSVRTVVVFPGIAHVAMPAADRSRSLRECAADVHRAVAVEDDLARLRPQESPPRV